MLHEVWKTCYSDCFWVATVWVLSKDVLADIEKAVSSYILADVAHLLVSCEGTNRAWLHDNNEIVFFRHSCASVLGVVIRHTNRGLYCDGVFAEQTQISCLRNREVT